MIIALVIMITGRFLVRQWLMLRGVAWYRKPAPGTTFIKEQLAYSLPMCMTSIVGLVAGMLDRMMIASSFSPADYATYAVGALEIPLDVIFQAAVANVLRASMPALVREGRLDEIVRLVRESVRKLSILVLPSFVFLLGYSYEFITLLFTKNYEGSVAVFRIYLFLLPLHMFILSPIPQAFGKTKANLYIVGTVTAVHVVLSWVLLKWLGYLGPAVSMVATQYLQSFLYMMIGLRLLQSSVAAMTPLIGFARVVAAAGASVLISRLLFSGAQIGLPGLAAAAAIFTVSYAVLSVVFGVFQSQDKALALRWMARLGLLPKKA
jgi:O-antigen/teichoic acid export membrane protein